MSRAWQVALVSLLACSDSAPPPDPTAAAFAEGRFADALSACGGDPCAASYCELVARTMLWVDDFNRVLLPTFRSTDISQATGNQQNLADLLRISGDMAKISGLVQDVQAGQCEYSIPTLPFLIGDAFDPIVEADIRGTWTPGSAAFIGAVIDSIRYLFAVAVGGATVPPAPSGESVPGLPDLLSSVRDRIAAHLSWVRAHPVTPSDGRGGWFDANGDGVMGEGDQLLIDLFERGSPKRVYDFEGAIPVDHESLPRGVLVPSLPPAKCGYAKWHIDTLFDKDVGTTDGLSFSPDGGRIAFPMKVNGLYQVHTFDGSALTCLTCSHPTSWNDGVRWRPLHPETMLFISTRDHPHSVGGAGGGFGQELYAMRADGTGATRLTTSGAWATNYHANWSHDGSRIVWGTTEDRTWDVMVADFKDDAAGMRLENPKRLVRDTSWWETHDFSIDGTKVITTNTRAGWQSADIYAIDIASGAKTRLTDDPAWDEHAHLSPDGREMSWISGRWRPASVSRMTDGSLGATYDFFWIGPAIFTNFVNPPAGFSTELTLMSTDGTGITRLTTDDQVCADNVWSPDGTKILFRQTPTGTQNPARIRMLTFDDCH
jgi:Tol biopolymer transport system component